ncbi:hypothetical protein JCM5296_002919 [Sporobolomyces johnsonii]
MISRQLTRPAATAATLLGSSRSFSSSTSSRAKRRGPTKSPSPIFDWRRPCRDDFPIPTATVINNPDAADEYLETLTSTRLTVDWDAGSKVLKGLVTDDVLHTGVLSIADAEGVLILQLALMKRPPSLLREILRDQSIEKQVFGARTFLREYHSDLEFFGDDRPVNIVDLEALCLVLHPKLANAGLTTRPINRLLTAYAAEALGQQFSTQAIGRASRSWEVATITSHRLDGLINQAWLTHLAGVLLREKLDEKVRKEDGDEEQYRSWMKELMDKVRYM